MQPYFAFIRTIVAGLLALCVLAGTVSIAMAADATDNKPHKIVFHVNENDPAKWNHVLSIAKNVQQALGKENVAIEVVAHGDGLNMLKMESEVANRMTEAQENGLVLAACAVTMKRQNVTEKDLHPGVKVVPIGVVEIVLKQESGWSYVKL
jgi:uncharacterized protein